MGQYVGIDLHDTPSFGWQKNREVLGTERFVSQPFELRPGHGRRPEPEVVLASRGIR